MPDGREVTNFTLVINDRYKTKTGERREVATFFKCAYWVSSKVAAHLGKGAIVSVSGRVGLDVYKDAAGEPKGTLSFHVNSIMFVANPQLLKKDAPSVTTQTTESTDDLPF